MKSLIFIILLVAFLITGGCTVGNQDPVVTPAPQIIYVTVPVTPVPTQMITTTPPAQTPVIHTPPPVTTPETDTCPHYTGAMPVSSPIMLTGTGDGLVFFEVKAPGKVRFNVTTYDPPRKDESCTDDQISFQLAGTTTCNQLNPIKTPGHFTRTTTLDLPFGGRYSITTKGCYGWQIDITNS
jgi:hypothetical protein